MSVFKSFTNGMDSGLPDGYYKNVYYTGSVLPLNSGATPITPIATNNVWTGINTFNNSLIIADVTDTSKQLTWNLSNSSASTLLTFYTNQKSSRSLSFPNITASDYVMTLNSTNNMSGALIFGGNNYSTGTASQSSTTVTGVGTTFTSAMVEELLNLQTEKKAL